MTLLQLVILALVQGITEFLPISSSGHLALAHVPLAWPDQGPEIDVAVHAGTLIAVMVYFRSDVARLATALFSGGRRGTPADRRLLLALVTGTIPIAIAGTLVLYVGWQDGFRSFEIIGWATLIFALPLYFADRYGSQIGRLADIRNGRALVVGMLQVLALIPGTSRSGITMTGARVLGIEREDAARFSMLLSIPAIIAAGFATGLQIWQAGDMALGLDALLAATLAAIAAFASISFLMAWLKRASFTPFVVYRILLGGGLLIWFYSST